MYEPHTDFCLWVNKGADQLHSYCEADQRLCFRYTDIRNFKFLAIFCDCTGRFVSDVVGNPEDQFSCVNGSNVCLSSLQGAQIVLNFDRKFNF